MQCIKATASISQRTCRRLLSFDEDCRIEYEKKAKFLEELKWVSDLCSDGKFELANNRAKFFGEKGESYSNVYKAFELLEKLKQLEKK